MNKQMQRKQQKQQVKQVVVHKTDSLNASDHEEVVSNAAQPG